MNQIDVKCNYVSTTEQLYLKHRQQTLHETIEIMSRLRLLFVKIEFSSKHLHTEQGKYNDEQKQQQQE